MVKFKEQSIFGVIYMLTDFDIRLKLIEKIKKENKGKEYRVVEEFVICDGLARTDVALVNGILHGYEIKSDFDSLDRLPNQIICYDSTFDKNTIVVGEKFADKIQKHVPQHWGIEVAYINRFGNITIKRLRTPKSNKNVNVGSLLDLLWNPEIKAYLKEHKIKGYSKMDKAGLKGLVEEFIPLKNVKEYTKHTLKTRTGWREDLQ